MTCARELERCIFCGAEEMTEEHIVSDWVLRAFMRTKRPEPGFSGTFVGQTDMRLHAGEAITTAKVVCRHCNNEWLSQIDNAAAGALKPLVRGKDDVTLTATAQRAVRRGCSNAR